ncbi:sialate O-acetylesterase [Listeria costaricensis]|uniref:sialate O-acetylesterase n=1 Tax=Listeria costaricensis TaxID=2026604 RepID=UPI000C0765E0|nr:sialate O-acetylesterase [Listeria costaricensis]
MTDFQLADVFTDGMILQRDREVSLYGSGQEGTVITCNRGTENYQAVVTNGVWQLTFPGKSKGETETIHLNSATCETVLTDVCYGDVYLLSGQSNIAFTFLENGGTYDPTALKNDVRYYTVPEVLYQDEDECIPAEVANNHWQKVDEDTVKEMSALGYYLAVYLGKQDPDVPIGFIGCYKGGTPAAAWLDEDKLQASPILDEHFLQPFQAILKNQSKAEAAQLEAEYLERLTAYQGIKEAWIAEHPDGEASVMKQEIGHTPWPPPLTYSSYQRPAGLYHTMLEHLTHCTIKAAIWYQGEEDSKNATLYDGLLAGMIEQMREMFENPSLPIFVVGLPGYLETDPESWAELRARQWQVCRETADVTLIPFIDQGESHNVHPTCKKAFGERLGYVIWQSLYQNDPVDTPHFEISRWTDTEIELVCRSTKQLTTHGDRVIVAEGQEIAYRINGNQLILTLNKPLDSFDYAYVDFPTGWLMTDEKIPVQPGRFNRP